MGRAITVSTKTSMLILSAISLSALFILSKAARVAVTIWLQRFLTAWDTSLFLRPDATVVVVVVVVVVAAGAATTAAVGTTVFVSSYSTFSIIVLIHLISSIRST